MVNFINQYLGFHRAAYWASMRDSIGARLSATYMTYWLPRSGKIWVIAFSALLLLVNLRSVAAGRFEFWFSMIKFTTIVAFILAKTALISSGHVTPQYNAHGDSFPGSNRSLLAIFLAIYAFGGVEILAVTTGESRSVRHSPRRATHFSSRRPLPPGAIIVLIGVMPWNTLSPNPFVSVLPCQNSGRRCS